MRAKGALERRDVRRLVTGHNRGEGLGLTMQRSLVDRLGVERRLEVLEGQGEVQDVRIRGRGSERELRQSANTRDFIFDIPAVIEAISAGITLLPGDLIATGTPAGVGIGFKPPKYLKHGDVVRIEIENIGVLENHVVADGAGA